MYQCKAALERAERGFLRDFMTGGLQENRTGMTALAKSSTKAEFAAGKDRKHHG
jgi:hypothetical protein